MMVWPEGWGRGGGGASGQGPPGLGGGRAGAGAASQEPAKPLRASPGGEMLCDGGGRDIQLSR